MIKELFKLIAKKNPKKFIGLISFIIFLSFLDLAGFALIPLFVKFFLDPNVIFDYTFFNFLSVYNLNSRNLLIIFSLIIICFFVCKNFLHFIFLLMKGSYVKKFFSNLKKDILINYLNRNYKFFLSQNTGFIIRNLTSEIEKVRYAIVELITIIKEVFLIFVLFLISLFMNPMSTFFVTFFLLVISVSFYLFFKPKLKIKGAQLQLFEGKEMKTLLDLFNSIKLIKILGKENYFAKFYYQNLQIIEDNKKFFYLVNSSPRIIFETLAIIIILLICLFFLIYGYDTKNSLPTIALLVFVSLRLLPSYNLITSSYSSIKYNSKSINLIVDIILNLKSSKTSNNNDIKNKNINFDNDIYIKDLKFHFNERPIIDFKNLTIFKNQVVGLIGKSGSGKSTFLNILSTMLTPDSGSITIGEKNIFEFLHSWKNKIGFVLQDTVLIDDTLKKNIAFGVEESDIDELKINNLISSLDLSEFVNNLDNGLETVLGDKGSKVSGGEKQRIGIARALYFSPELLLLDEPTSSLDAQTEKKILKEIINLTKNKITVILCTHSENSLEICDTVYKVEHGTISRVY